MQTVYWRKNCSYSKRLNYVSYCAILLLGFQCL